MTPITALIIGLGLGLFYFGTFWLTIQQLPVIRYPYKLIFFSFLFRLGISLFILSLIVSGNTYLYNVISLLACFLGFLVVRKIAILLIKSRIKVKTY